MSARLVSSVIVLLALLLNPITSADNLYVITSPPGADSSGICSYIYKIENGAPSVISRINIESQLIGMTLDEERSNLYVFGDAEQDKMGYILYYDLNNPLVSRRLLMSFLPDFGLYFSIPRTSENVYTWNLIEPGNGREGFEANFKKSSIEKVSDNGRRDLFGGYCQSGPFGFAFDIIFDENGDINYKEGDLKIPSGILFPSEFKIDTTKNPKIRWIGFANDDSHLAFKGLDDEADKLFMYIYDRKMKSWMHLQVDGSESDIWANRYGFAYKSILTEGNGNHKFSPAMKIYTYDLKKSWVMTVPENGEIIYMDQGTVITHASDSIYSGALEGSTPNVILKQIAQSALLENVCSAFKLADPKR